ncbi:FAD-dependent oxidoreductase [Rhodococcus wratislaviensis]|uniref:ferredoxin--NADP(+) reductase n=1 Tax=Rhodococcus wratislaviensis NBRC 100605 TaxID=1219028 RepID=X0PWE5_RHOWR|nr:FAD-dependent oxidoreductase [Rhodococcus wratislaviensis]GAF47608.1 putative ferredoxin--NADP(+) reductase [Rhodococcus wratislaviensis NBRC 100605]
MKIPFRVAVIGSGPSGIYAAQLLCESEELDAQVDVYERLPVPYGLVRYGVAPDHPKIKSIVGQFADVFTHPCVRFIGNVTVGKDVTLDELRGRYDAVVVASGANHDRRLGIPGEHLGGICSATEFVAWYSGHPDSPVDRFAISGETAVVVGAGNVALDVARMLNRTPDELRRTDMPEHVIDAITTSGISDVWVLARRGPAFAKFTNKELIELGSLTDCDVIVDPRDLELDAEQRAVARSPLVARRMAVLHDYAATAARAGRRSLRLAFNRQPVEFVGGEHVSSIRIRSGRGCGDSPVELNADFVVRSIGYRGSEFAGLPFDESRGIIPNTAGRVTVAGEQRSGVYVVGWIKRGPSGVIGTNRKDADETVASMVEDARSLRDGGAAASVGDPLELLRNRAVPVVDWEGWRSIDQAEIDLGRECDRDRVKIHTRQVMLDAVR